MTGVTIDMTREQKIKLQNEMGVIADRLVFSHLPEGDEIRIGDLDDTCFIVCGETYVNS